MATEDKTIKAAAGPKNIKSAHSSATQNAKVKAAAPGPAAAPQRPQKR